MTKATGSTNLVRSLAWLVTSGFAVCGAGFLALALVGTVDMLLIQSQAGDLTHGLELSADLLIWAWFAASGHNRCQCCLLPTGALVMVGVHGRIKRSADRHDA